MAGGVRGALRSFMGGAVYSISDLFTRSNFSLVELEDILHFRNYNKHSNHLVQVSILLYNSRIHKSIDMHRLAWFPLFGVRTSDRLSLTQD